ncbi:hypothetical protein IKF27_01475 [Candidatus Saccharibacteria bacterium]|nr:hypothetical protein [Candidatus Saccharibacteria bacterium]
MEKESIVRKPNNTNTGGRVNAAPAGYPAGTVGGVRFGAAMDTTKKTPVPRQAPTRQAAPQSNQSTISSNVKKSSPKKTKKTVAIAIISLIALAAVGLGAFFIIKNLSSPSDTGEANTSETTSDTNNEEGPSGDPDYRPTLGGDFTVFEQRGDGYYIEVQVNNEYSGSCEFSIFSVADETPTKGAGQLTPNGAVSVCSTLLPYNVAEGNAYTIEAVVKSGEESVNLSRNVEP